MRVAVLLVVTVLVVTTPSEASQSCMSKTEARQHFGAAVHLYWYGPDHCWDASPTQRRQTINRAQRAHQKIDEVQQETKQPKWQDLMSMASDDEVVRPLSVRTTLEVDRHVGTPWVDRWVDIETSSDQHREALERLGLTQGGGPQLLGVDERIAEMGK